MKLRLETEADHVAVHNIHAAAFETDAEARLVSALRANAHPIVSIVAVDDSEEVFGHILFTPVTLSPELSPEPRPETSPTPAETIMGLAPMAVSPALQRQGIGSDLVRAGLEQCAEIGTLAVIVLGHPDYYPKFGFQPASTFGLRSTYDVPDEVFMARELVPDGLADRNGIVHYHPAFGEI